ncbi:hypothetical protein MRX96_011965 [Rhipicephalus microplus]
MVGRRQLEKYIREYFSVNCFPQAVGAICGCNFAVYLPNEHENDYHNYKKCIILLAVVDHRYCFKYINVSVPGEYNDAYVYERSRHCCVLLFKSVDDMADGFSQSAVGYLRDLRLT